MTKLCSIALLTCIAASANAADVTYDLSGGKVTSFSASGSLADGEFQPTFPFPSSFTLDTSTLNGSVVNGIGTYTEHFDVSAPANENLFGEGFFNTESGSADFTINYSGAKPVVTSFDVGVYGNFPSGDLKGFDWGFDYVKTAGGSTLTISEEYLPYIGNDYGTATETLKNVKISLAAPTKAPEIDPASAASGVTLLFGSLAVLRSRKRREITA